ncbi:DNA-directed RNA polymerase III subunit RPC8 isoform X2 [Teleopsis dalmanni]|uniref:DNA-directed RNA polymerase III subunit RPC8 isoform X2 n=1 Tax=Teleopsis dalmanni TaxID=139649 RepID=UPI0018CEB884|nr:DNA-directed RNA polymerase III subunit RPC8 isoform X2 [Teleopsis dalmanni]
MFVLAELKDTIRIEPSQFHIDFLEALRDEINRKLANKVLLNVGLCIALKDIVSIEKSLILPGDGASHTEVVFRYIVFRPQVGSVITGKIRSCSHEGVHVTLGFFDDILIPPAALQHPSRFEETEQAWVWEYPLENNEKHDLFMDIGESIKFRVASECFEESSPIGPPKTDQQVTSSTLAQKEIKTPYRIVAAINESGLGVLSWWDQQNQDMDEGDENNEEDNVEYENDENGEEDCS